MAWQIPWSSSDRNIDSLFESDTSKSTADQQVIFCFSMKHVAHLQHSPTTVIIIVVMVIITLIINNNPNHQHSQLVRHFHYQILSVTLSSSSSPSSSSIAGLLRTIRPWPVRNHWRPQHPAYRRRPQSEEEEPEKAEELLVVFLDHVQCECGGVGGAPVQYKVPAESEETEPEFQSGDQNESAPRTIDDVVDCW